MNTTSALFRFPRTMFAVLLCPAFFVFASCSFFGPDEPEMPEVPVEAEPTAETDAAEQPKPTAEISAPLVIPPAPDYANPASWVRMGAGDSVLPEFEVFYIYPTLFQNKLRPVMDHRFERIRTKATQYTDLTFGLLTDPTHPLKLFAPFVRQADYSTALETDFTSDLGDTLLQYGIKDTKTAFQYFMKYSNAVFVSSIPYWRSVPSRSAVKSVSSAVE